MPALIYLFLGSGFHQFSFRIKFYSSEPSINLQEEITRYQFVLQLKRDILKGLLPVPYDTMIELSAQALQGKNQITYFNRPSNKAVIFQDYNYIIKITTLCMSLLTAEIGDYQPEVHEPDLVSEFLFAPNQDEQMEMDTFERYKDLR